MISPAAVISLCDDIVQRTMISSHCSDFGTFHLSIRCGCPHPTVIPSVAWESSRQAHFAPLDCHVATFVAPRNDKEKLNCCALYLRQFTSFPFQEMFRLRFTPLNMTHGGGCHTMPTSCHPEAQSAVRISRERKDVFKNHSDLPFVGYAHVTKQTFWLDSNFSIAFRAAMRHLYHHIVLHRHICLHCILQ